MARVAELAGMGAGIRQGDDGVGIGDQFRHFLFVEVHDGHAEARLEVAGEGEVEGQVDRVLAQLGGGLRERLLLEFLGRRRPGNDRAIPPALEEGRELGRELAPPGRIRVGATACPRGRASSTVSSFMNFMTSKMNGSAKVNSKLSGRQLTSGMTSAPDLRCWAARSSCLRCPPGPLRSDRSAVHLTRTPYF